LPPLSLHAESGPDGRSAVWADLSEDGSLSISGQDLGPMVTKWFGEGFTEYEWSCTVQAADVPTLVIALGGADGDDILEVLARPTVDLAGNASSFLKEHNIRFEFWSGVGE
jgi:hypothetical protein